MDIDEVYTKTGELGNFQKRVIFAFCISNIFLGTQMVQNVMVGWHPKPGDLACLHGLQVCAGNCKGANVTIKADAAMPNYYSYPIEWGLLCKPAQADLTQSVYMCGVLTGSLLVGGLSDQFGRLPILLICNTMIAVFGLSSSFAPIWTVYAALRFFTGLFLAGGVIVGFVLGSELVGATKRNLVSCLSALCFSVGICLLAFVAKLTGEWRLTALVLGAIGFPIVPLIWWAHVESPRWYLSKGNIDECKLALSKIAECNGHQLGEFSLKVQGNSAGSGKSTSMLSLFSHPIMRKLTLIQLFSWFTVSSTYYGLTIASGSMSTDMFSSLALNAITEVPSNLLVLVLMNRSRFGRVKTCVVSMILSSFCCGIIMFLPSDAVTTAMVCATLGKFFICMAFSIVYVQAAELYPTNVRNVGIGLTSVANRLGGIFSPMIVTLSSVVYENSHFAVFATLALIAGCLCSLLPETLGKPLPTCPEDIYKEKRTDGDVVHMTTHEEFSDKQRLFSDIDDLHVTETM